MPKNEKAPKYTVIRDTREQEGYYFSEYDLCLGMIDQKLDTGDYSIVGLEDKICVERKGCVEELAINLGQKKHTFLREIERMKKVLDVCEGVGPEDYKNWCIILTLLGNYVREIELIEHHLENSEIVQLRKDFCEDTE